MSVASAHSIRYHEMVESEGTSMATSNSELMDAALALPEPARAELAELLSASLTSAPTPLHPAWAAELRRRTSEVESGSVKPIPGDEVRRQVQAQLDNGGPGHG